MLRTLIALGLIAALPVSAETLSQEIGRTGITPTAARLAALPNPTEDEQLALGALSFLGAVEGSFQTRWTYGLTDRTGMLPFLRLGIPDNPSPQAFEALVIARIFTEAEADLAQAITRLDALPETSGAVFEVTLADLWFDVDTSGTRSPGEGLTEIVGSLAFGADPAAGEGTAPLPTLRFDRADAAWASAYAHMLSGVSEAILAYDPSEPIDRILKARASLAEYGPPVPSFFTGLTQVPDELDMVALVLASLEQTPDAARMGRAHGHFLQMIAENRRFWRLVDAETDNAGEWLPNARQVSAFGVALPAETAALWQSVLAEAEAALKGEVLIPYWRTGTAGGVNLQRVFLEPAPVDIAGWIQGWAAVPYLEKGPLMTGESWSRFNDMLAGDAMLFALWLN